MTENDILDAIDVWHRTPITADNFCDTLHNHLGWTSAHYTSWAHRRIVYAEVDAGPRDADGAPCEAT